MRSERIHFGCKVRHGRFMVLLAWLPTLCMFPVMAGTTIYVGKHFEVRDHDQPVKYVFNGATRVARVTGSLSTNTRIQRLRLHPGWNLCSVAVGGARLASSPQTAAYKWNQTGLDWFAVSTNDALAAGTVLWLHATTNTVLALTGAYADPTNRPVALGGSFQPGAGLEALPLPGHGADAALWHYDAASQGWEMRVPAVPGFNPGFPEFLAPGEAIFMNAGAPAELETPEAALRIRYYHQDHLGSSSVMTDAVGALVEESAFYPFGVPRNEHRLRQIEEHYKFTQKERDRESGLHYFEARYLASPTGRFLSVDTKYANPDGFSGDDLKGFLVQPQENNLYSYAGNNPLKYTDPTGLEVWNPFRGDSLDELDIGQTLINIMPAVGPAAGSIANFVSGSDYDTSSLFAQGVSEPTGSKTAGMVAESVVGLAAGGGLKELGRLGVNAFRGLLTGSAKSLAPAAEGAAKALVGPMAKAAPGALADTAAATASGSSGANVVDTLTHTLMVNSEIRVLEAIGVAEGPERVRMAFKIANETWKKTFGKLPGGVLDIK